MKKAKDQSKYPYEIMSQCRLMIQSTFNKMNDKEIIKLGSFIVDMEIGKKENKHRKMVKKMNRLKF